MGSGREERSETPMELLGLAIGETCRDPLRDTLGLHALVIYCAEYAHLMGLEFTDLRAALQGCLAAHARDCDPQLRYRLGVELHRWATVAYRNARDGRGEAHR